MRQTEKTGVQMMLCSVLGGGVFVHIPGSHSFCWQVILLEPFSLPAPCVYVLGFSPTPSLSKYFSMPLKNVKMWSAHNQRAGSMFFLFFSGSCSQPNRLLCFILLTIITCLHATNVRLYNILTLNKFYSLILFD